MSERTDDITHEDYRWTDHEKELHYLNQKSNEFQTSADAQHETGPKTLSPAQLDQFDRQHNREWWQEQERLTQRNALSTTRGAVKMGNDAARGGANDALKVNEHGDPENPHQANRLFAGGAQARHEYMYGTDPAYKERHDYWSKTDAPIEAVRGPVEGAIWAAALPGGFVSNSIKQAAVPISIDMARERLSSERN